MSSRLGAERRRGRERRTGGEGLQGWGRRAGEGFSELGKLA